MLLLKSSVELTLILMVPVSSVWKTSTMSSDVVVFLPSSRLRGTSPLKGICCVLPFFLSELVVKKRGLSTSMIPCESVQLVCIMLTMGVVSLQLMRKCDSMLV